VAFADQTNALIQWQTDEPASSVVHFGGTPALGQTISGPAGLYVQAHAQLLTGLQPSTTYHARVESTDPHDNGPVTSDIISFTTAETPDTAAPVITAGPSVLGVTECPCDDGAGDLCWPSGFGVGGTAVFIERRSTDEPR
jgi:hypothetical protein